MQMPELHDLEALRLLAADLLKPGPNQRVVIMIVDDPEEPLTSNVLPLHGGPVMTGEDERREERERTAEMFRDLAERAEAGEIRHAAVVVGHEGNERSISGVETAFTPHIYQHHAVFMGGVELLKMDMHESYSEIRYMIEDDEE